MNGFAAMNHGASDPTLLFSCIFFICFPKGVCVPSCVSTQARFSLCLCVVGKVTPEYFWAHRMNLL